MARAKNGGRDKAPGAGQRPKTHEQFVCDKKNQILWIWDRAGLAALASSYPAAKSFFGHERYQIHRVSLSMLQRIKRSRKVADAYAQKVLGTGGLRLQEVA